MSKNLVLIFAFLALLFSSCGGNLATIMGGLGSGMYGGGMYGGVPYGLQPNVAVEQSAAIINNNLQSQMSDMWKNGVPADPVSTSSTPVMNTSSAAVGGSYYSSSSSSSSSSSGRQHDLCNGTGKCKTCNGTGSMWKGYGQSGKTRCPNCNGTGRCSGCNGTGRR